MYYEGFNNYTKMYKSGLSSIKNSKKYLKLDKNFALKENRYRDNYTVTFSKKGILTNLFEYRYDADNKLSHVTQYTYTYDRYKKLKMIIGIDLFTRVLSNTIEFKYNCDDQIAEEYYYGYLYGEYPSTEYSCIHRYKDNYHVLEHYDYDNDREHHFETWYDSSTGTVDEKITEETEEASVFHSWNRSVYSKSGRLSKVFELNEKGEIDREAEYFYEPDKEISIDYGKENTYWETVIERDTQNHRVQKNHFRNGILIAIEEQQFEYY